VRVSAGRRLDDVRHVALVGWPGRSTRASRRSAWRAGSGRSRCGWRCPRARPTPSRERSGTRCRRCASSSATASRRRGARRRAGSRGMPRSVYQRCARRSSTRATPRPRRADEELHLHLLELAGAEDEVAGVISLRNDLPIWAMPNGGFLRASGQDVLEVDEDALRGLGAQVVLSRPVELARLGARHREPVRADALPRPPVVVTLVLSRCSARSSSRASRRPSASPSCSWSSTSAERRRHRRGLYEIVPPPRGPRRLEGDGAHHSHGRRPSS
jgi:hypothetical protein